MKYYKILSPLTVGILLIAIIPTISATILNKQITNDTNELSINGVTTLYIKVCYLEMVGPIDAHWIADPSYKAEFYWKITVKGGVDENGKETWRHRYSKDNQQFVYEVDLEKEKGNPHTWDVTGLDAVFIIMELRDIDTDLDRDDYCDINGALYSSSQLTEADKIVRFIYDLRTHEVKFLDDSGGKIAEWPEGCIEFDGREDTGDVRTGDAIMKVRVWDEFKNLPPSCQVTTPKKGYLYYQNRELFPINSEKWDAIVISSNLQGIAYDDDGEISKVLIHRDDGFVDEIEPNKAGIWSAYIYNGEHVYYTEAVDNDGAHSKKSEKLNILAFRCYDGALDQKGKYDNAPPFISSEIKGPETGITGKSYEYSLSVIDFEKDEIKIYVDWGDNTNTGWIFYNSNQKISHSWLEPGDYTIIIKTKDNNNNNGLWNATKNIHINKKDTREYLPSYFLKLFRYDIINQIHRILKNILQ